MKRIFITGATGAGKSFLAKKIAEKLGLQHHCLDDLSWQPNWQRTPVPELVEKVKTLVRRDSWVIDGADTRRRVTPEILKRADVFVWIDTSPVITLLQMVPRTLWNAFKKRPLCNGNYEKFSDIFSHNSVFIWSVKSWADNKRMLTPVFKEAAARGSKVQHIRLKNRRQVRAFLRDFKK